MLESSAVFCKVHHACSLLIRRSLILIEHCLHASFEVALVMGSIKANSSFGIELTEWPHSATWPLYA